MPSRHLMHNRRFLLLLSATRGSVIGELPSGYVYLVNDSGLYLLNDDGAYLVVPAVVESDYEDLSTYTLVDEHSDFAIDDTKLTVTTYEYDHATSYVYYDFGAAYFGVNCEIQFEINVSALADEYGPCGVLALTNDLGTGHDIGEGPCVKINDQDVGNDYIELWTGHGDYSASTHLHNTHVLNTTYYCTLISTYAAGNASTVKLGVYTDAARTILAGGTVPYGVGNILEAHGSQTFRYLLLAQSANAASSDPTQISMVIDHIEIISH